MYPQTPGGRHRRRRLNMTTRATLDEARRAGLVQRHLTKLRYLADRARASPEPEAQVPESPPEPRPSTSDAA